METSVIPRVLTPCSNFYLITTKLYRAGLLQDLARGCRRSHCAFLTYSWTKFHLTPGLRGYDMKYEGLMSGRWDLCSTNVIRGGKRECNIGSEEVMTG